MRERRATKVVLALLALGLWAAASGCAASSSETTPTGAAGTSGTTGTTGQTRVQGPAKADSAATPVPAPTDTSGRPH